MTQAEVAKKISVARETVNRWCGEYAFQCALHALSQESLTTILRRSVLRAEQVLNELMSSDKPDTIRLRAATAILGLTHRTTRI